MTTGSDNARGWPAKQDVPRRLRSARLTRRRSTTGSGWAFRSSSGEREGDFIWDMDGHRLYDMHLNGGTYNLGHRNPEVIEAMVQAARAISTSATTTSRASPAAELAQTFDRLTPGGPDLQCLPSKRRRGERPRDQIGEERDRAAEGDQFDHGFHGPTGLATCAGDDSRARFFKSDRPDEFLTVPFADIDAVEHLLDDGDVAAVLLESIPATWGFAVPPPDYLPEVVRLAHEYGALFIADEVQVGLGRTGKLWSVETFGIEPDILVSGKGLSGGVYPIAATVMNPRAGQWLFDNGWGHSSTYGGSEIGCRVAQKVLEITTRPETVANVECLAAEFGGAFEAIAAEDPYLVEVRRCGVIFGLRFAHPAGAAYMQRELYARGVWAIASGYDESVLQFKPGLLLERAAVGDVLDRFRAALVVAREQDYEIVRRQPMARA